MDRGPGGLQSLGLQRVGHDWETEYLSIYIHTHHLHMLPVDDVFQWTGLVKFYLGQFVSLFRWSMCSKLSCTFFFSCSRLITLGFQTKANKEICTSVCTSQTVQTYKSSCHELDTGNEEAIVKTSSICFAMNGFRPTQNYLRSNNCLRDWSVFSSWCSHWTKYSTLTMKQATSL